MPAPAHGDRSGLRAGPRSPHGACLNASSPLCLSPHVSPIYARGSPHFPPQIDLFGVATKEHPPWSSALVVREALSLSVPLPIPVMATDGPAGPACVLARVTGNCYVQGWAMRPVLHKRGRGRASRSTDSCSHRRDRGASSPGKAWEVNQNQLSTAHGTLVEGAGCGDCSMPGPIAFMTRTPHLPETRD